MDFRHVSAFGAGLSAVVIAMAGCGGSTTGSSSPVPQDQFADSVVSAICDNVGACCTSSGFPYDRAGCAAMLKPIYSQVATDPSVTYDANAAGACIHALAASASSCTDLTSDGAICDRVFNGTKPVGAPCQSDVECAAPAGGKAYCSSDGNGNQTCMAQARGKAGDGCQETCTEAPGGSSCFGGSGTGGAGGAGGSVPGTATCYTNDGLYCNASSVCAALAKIGESCDYNGCVGGAYCDGSVCVAKIAAGQPCPSYDSCADTAYCNDSGMCVNKKADGAACQSGDECSGGSCNAGACAKSSPIASAELCGATPTPQPGGGSGGAGNSGGSGTGTGAAGNSPVPPAP